MTYDFTKLPSEQVGAFAANAGRESIGNPTSIALGVLVFLGVAWLTFYLLSRPRPQSQRDQSRGQSENPWRASRL